MNRRMSRRHFLQVSGSAAAALGLSRGAFAADGAGARPLAEVGYDQVTVTSAPHLAQLENTHGVLMGLSNDSLMKPLRAMAGLAAPGDDMGGWYSYRAELQLSGRTRWDLRRVVLMGSGFRRWLGTMG